jgi:hypothetical protein
MEPINRNSRTTIHFQLAYVLAIPWTPDPATAVDFQKALLENKLEFSQTNAAPKRFTLIRTQPSHLQVILESPAPQVSGIQIIANNPAYDCEGFAKDAAAVTTAYQQTWPAQQYQLIKTTAKVHHLYSSQEHAFQYLWENRLGQSPGDFECLGPRPVAGGGIRLLMPPHADGEELPCSIELRIESFLREPRKLFIETTFTWPQPRLITADQKFDPEEFLAPLEQYAANEVWTFITQTKNNNPEQDS